MANSADPDQLASKKPTDLDIHCLQGQDISRFSRTRVKATSNHQLAFPQVLAYRVRCSMFCLATAVNS